MVISPLRDLERRKDLFDPASARIKREHVRSLRRTVLTSAEQVRRLHEVLCFLRAYPDDAALLAAVRAALGGFSSRPDLKKYRSELQYSGIAGTTLWFPFFYPTARWVASEWPQQLTLDRSDTVAGTAIAGALPALLTPAEAHGVREAHLGGFDALDRVRGRETDATFLIRRVDALPADERTREAFYDGINPSCELAPGRDTPSRTRALLPNVQPVWQREPVSRARPDLAEALRSKPRAVRRMGSADARALIRLARESLATRQRDLDAFAYANERDVWWIVDKGGLAFALVGMVASRRPAVPAVYGGLSFQNGVPIGYHQCDFTGRAAALSFNVFETFRGGGAAHVFARWLAALHALFGATSFSIEPYQLGHNNDEGLQSGAWWFYAKLGFAPRDRAAQRMAEHERERQARSPSYRTRLSRLRALAAHPLFFEADRAGPQPFMTPAAIGLAVARRLSALAGSDRARGIALARRQATRLLGLRSLAHFTDAERFAFDAWAPLVTLLNVDRWPRADRAALVDLIRAKAAGSERGYVKAFSSLARLPDALARLAATRTD